MNWSRIRTVAAWINVLRRGIKMAPGAQFAVFLSPRHREEP